VAIGIVNTHFGTLMAAVHTLTMALLGACAVSGALKINGRKLMSFGITTVLLTIATIGAVRVLFAATVPTVYDKDKVLAGMQMLRDASARVVAGAEPVPRVDDATRLPALDRIRKRGTLRVGYLDDSLPYAFVNARGDLVGFDVEMAYHLAQDLGVALELTPASRAMFTTGLDPALCDLVMSGTAITAERALQVLFSTSYLDETLAFVVPDRQRAAFSEWDRIRAMPRLRVGVPRAPYFLAKAQEELPQAEIVPIDAMGQMFERRDPPLDAFLSTAERGSAYTLLHPEYSVAVPQPRPSKVPLAYVVAGRDEALATVVNTWIELKRKDGTIEALFAHWILGRDASVRKPRFSIVRDVLHWIS